MTDRIELQHLLENALGSRNVYFQPPENLKMSFPAIVYNREKIIEKHANNLMYGNDYRYKIILIDKDPESEAIEKILTIPKTSHANTYVSENMNHDVFYTYY